MKNHVSIILLNYNQYSDTIECLGSLLKCTYENFSLIIIDNGSKDGSLIEFNNWFHKRSKDEKKKIIIIANKENIGFSAGNNIGIKYALKNYQSDYLWVLNTDTVVEPDALSTLVICSEGKNVCGSKLIYYDHRDKVQAYGGGYIHSLIGTSRDCTDNNLRKDKYGQIKLDYICGASMLLPANALKEVGLFDESYFLYFEDADLSKRMSLAGYPLKYCSNSIVYHKVGKSTRASNPTNKPLLPDIESIKNRFAYIRRYMPKAIIFFSYVSLIITVIRRIQRRQLSRIHIIIKAAITLKNPLLPPS